MRSRAFDIYREARRAVMGRQWVGGWRGRTDSRRTSSWNTPVEIVDGTQSPTLAGLGYWKTTFRGPGGFVKTLYTPSTLRVVVGRDWRPGGSGA